MDSQNKCSCKNEWFNIQPINQWIKKANVVINRKMLAEMAVSDPAAFTKVAEIAKKTKQLIKGYRKFRFSIIFFDSFPIMY